MYFRFFLTLGLVMCFLSGKAQLVVTPANAATNSLQSMIQRLVGEGVTVSNITTNQFQNSDVYGTFSQPTANFGIASGILLTTGSIFNAVGPNNTPSETGLGISLGDADLQSISRGGSVRDACIIQFDIVSKSTFIQFNYIFASEEYPEFVGSAFNDVFGFFISGPGYVGVNNIALIPGLNNTQVSINNVNETTNSSFYRANGDGIFSGGSLLQYDGYTTKLTARAVVTPCLTYRIKLAIADVADEAYDSGVFIESGSLTSNEYLLLGALRAPDSLKICASQLPVSLTAGFEQLPTYQWTNNTTLLSETSKVLSVTSGGWFRVRANRTPTCFWADSIFIEVLPDFDLATADVSICVGASIPISVSPSVLPFSSYTYLWSPSQGLSSSSSRTPTASPSSSRSYQVQVSNGQCTRTASVFVTVNQLISLQAPSVVRGCINEPIRLSASGADRYRWTPAAFLLNADTDSPSAIVSDINSFIVEGYNDCYSQVLTVQVFPAPKPLVDAYGDTSICFSGSAQLRADFLPNILYTWAPPSGLSSTSIHNPIASPQTTQEYVLSADNEGCVKLDTVVVLVTPPLKAIIKISRKVGKVPFTVSFNDLSLGATERTWFVPPFENVVTSSFQLVYDQEGVYQVVLEAKNNLGCVDYDTVSLKAYEFFIPTLFTPNGDGLNDTFRITGLGENYDLEVYNRWGDRVYLKSNYKNEWDGEGLSDGVYYFMITDTFFRETYKGWVQLTR